MTIITRTEFVPEILRPISLFKARRISVTTAIDNPTERTILSMIFSRSKKTSVQAKPGRKKTSINPSPALIMENRSKKGKVKSTIPLICSSRVVILFSNVLHHALYILLNLQGKFKHEVFYHCARSISDEAIPIASHMRLPRLRLAMTKEKAITGKETMHTLYRS